MKFAARIFEAAAWLAAALICIGQVTYQVHEQYTVSETEIREMRELAQLNRLNHMLDALLERIHRADWQR